MADEERVSAEQLAGCLALDVGARASWVEPLKERHLLGREVDRLVGVAMFQRREEDCARLLTIFGGVIAGTRPVFQGKQRLTTGIVYGWLR